jgi:hypothetical protein
LREPNGEREPDRMVSVRLLPWPVQFLVSGLSKYASMSSNTTAMPGPPEHRRAASCACSNRSLNSISGGVGHHLVGDLRDQVLDRAAPFRFELEVWGRRPTHHSAPSLLNGGIPAYIRRRVGESQLSLMHVIFGPDNADLMDQSQLRVPSAAETVGGRRPVEGWVSCNACPRHTAGTGSSNDAIDLSCRPNCNWDPLAQ